MYKFDKTITLVTIASPLNQNLALLDVNEYVISDTLAVIHEGFVNVIPILDSDKRCKYVGVNSSKTKGKSSIKQVQKKIPQWNTIFIK